MSKKYQFSKVSYGLSYSIEEICSLYSHKKLSPQTVYDWIKKENLKTIDNKEPKLIYGKDLKDFLKNRNKKSLHKLDFKEFYCMSCKDYHLPFNNEIIIDEKKNFYKAKALCPYTKKAMFKSFSKKYLNKIQQTFKVGELLRLYESADSTLNTEISSNKKFDKFLDKMEEENANTK